MSELKKELIKEFEEKYKRWRFLSDSGIGDAYREHGSYCDKYVEFLEQKLEGKKELLIKFMESLDSEQITLIEIAEFEQVADSFLSDRNEK